MDLTSEDPTLNLPFILLFRAGPVPIPFYFPLKPQFATVALPSRGQVHQTLDSNFLDLFPGPRSVLAKVNLRGTFGYHNRLGGIGIDASGSGHLKTLEALYETFNGLSRTLAQRAQVACDYIVPGRAYFWRVWIDHFLYRQAKDDPLLMFYDLTMVRVFDYLSPGTIPRLSVSDLPGGSAIAAVF